MDFPLKELIGSAVTIAVAILGWTQWKRTKRSGRFIEDRETAYNEVWQSLEDAHLYVRRESFNQLLFDELVAKANTILIRKALHIADDDRIAAANYIAALNRFGIIMAQAKISPDSRREIYVTAQSAPLPNELIDAFSAVQDSRQIVMDKFRRAIGAGLI
jgi:hypothetical protein